MAPEPFIEMPLMKEGAEFEDVLYVLDPGIGATIQDLGRTGWRRFGVPPSGAMDQHAASWANRLVGNPPEAPVIELLLQGAKIAMMQTSWIAITGAEMGSNLPTGRAVEVRADEIIHFPHNKSGVWAYVAVQGWLTAPRFLGSASVYARGRMGRPLVRGNILSRNPGVAPAMPQSVAGRILPWTERRTYTSPPSLRVWPGPQWEALGYMNRADFFNRHWSISPRSDRVGYRLTGSPLTLRTRDMISEPVRVGTIQIPPDGFPMVTMRDGPTVGGYLKLGMVDPEDLSWLAQCRPGQRVHFHPME